MLVKGTVTFVRAWSHAKPLGETFRLQHLKLSARRGLVQRQQPNLKRPPFGELAHLVAVQVRNHGGKN